MYGAVYANVRLTIATAVCIAVIALTTRVLAVATTTLVRLATATPVSVMYNVQDVTE